MPRYFFHLHTESRFDPDVVGVEFRSLEEAVADARQARTEFMRDEGDRRWSATKAVPLRDHRRAQRASRYGASRRQLAGANPIDNRQVAGSSLLRKGPVSRPRWRGCGRPGPSFATTSSRGPGGSQILLVDPSGNLVELFRPASAAHGAR